MVLNVHSWVPFVSVLTIRTTAQRCKPANQENCEPGQQQHHANFLQATAIRAWAVKAGMSSPPGTAALPLCTCSNFPPSPCSSNAHWQPGRDRHEDRRGGTKERGEEGVTRFAIRPVLPVIASPQREQLSGSKLVLYECCSKGRRAQSGAQQRWEKGGKEEAE